MPEESPSRTVLSGESPSTLPYAIPVPPEEAACLPVLPQNRLASSTQPG